MEEERERENFVVRLMTISLFHVLFISFFFSFRPVSTLLSFLCSQRWAARRERICGSSVPLPLKLTLSTSASHSLPLSPAAPKHPGSLVPTVCDCQTLTLPLCAPPSPLQQPFTPLLLTSTDFSEGAHSNNKHFCLALFVCFAWLCHNQTHWWSQYSHLVLAAEVPHYVMDRKAKAG